MMRFLIGVAVGLAVAHWYYTNGESVTGAFEQMWESASAAPSHMQKQDPDPQSVKGKRF
jgi:hypothetical protein